MPDDPNDHDSGTTIDWDRHPQAFRWFPELGGHDTTLPTNNPLSPPPAAPSPERIVGAAPPRR